MINLISRKHLNDISASAYYFLPDFDHIAIYLNRFNKCIIRDGSNNKYTHIQNELIILPTTKQRKVILMRESSLFRATLKRIELERTKMQERIGRRSRPNS